jgi:hypothetical protein
MLCPVRGFQTAFVARPLKFEPNGAIDLTYDDAFDVNATDFLDLAEQLPARRTSGPAAGIRHVTVLSRARRAVHGY